MSNNHGTKKPASNGKLETLRKRAERSMKYANAAMLTNSGRAKQSVRSA